MVLRLRVIFATVVLALGSSMSAQSGQPLSPEQGHGLAVRRAGTLTRGINLSGWFGGWGDYSPERTSTYITAADVASLKALGIRYVRFPLDPVLLMRGGLLAQGSQRDELWKRIDDALDMLMNAGIAIDFVVFPRDDYKQTLTTQHGVDQFVMLWQVLARHFAGRDPERFFFELMNESQTSDPYRWLGIQAQATYAIRQIAPRHTVLASGAHYDSVPDLLETQPLHDANVIYTFHFYEPYQFTHQGAPWGSIEWNEYKSIPYPATPSRPQPSPRRSRRTMRGTSSSSTATPIGMQKGSRIVLRLPRRGGANMACRSSATSSAPSGILPQKIPAHATCTM